MICGRPVISLRKARTLPDNALPSASAGTSLNRFIEFYMRSVAGVKVGRVGLSD
jgi:hypothetical protein